MVLYESVIGLEIHVQLNTASKLFCSCSTAFGAEPNLHVCPVCAGMPGALPRLNKRAVELAAKAGVALNCTVNELSIFSRKSYFYPDLPGGYQTTQLTPPICEHGFLNVCTEASGSRRIGITRIHLEDDAGKCVHGQSGKSCVDLNRAGMPLIEIVSEPDLRTAEEAALFMKQVHDLLTYLDITDGNMEEGSMRCDANISLRPRGETAYGTRTEIKNLNSFRNVQRAIESEIERQTACLEDGEAIIQQTRLFDSVKQVTQAMRSKEDAHDYRYYPNPDLPPVLVSKEMLAEWKASLPEFPQVRKERFMKDFSISEEDAAVLTADKTAADFFEAATAFCSSPKRMASLMRMEFLRECSEAGIGPDEAKMTPALLGELATIIDNGVLSTRMAHDIFPALFASGQSPEAYAREKGLVQVSDTAELEAVVASVVQANPEEVMAYKDGKLKLMSFFVGQVMRQTKGKANPGMVSELLQKYLS